MVARGRRRRGGSGKWYFGIGALVVVLGTAVAYFALKDPGPSGGSAPTAGRVDLAWDDSWPPLPQGRPPARPIGQVRAAYAFVAKQPELAQYLPCFCGCSRSGHESVKDCFVKGRAADGQPEWNTMGFG